VPPLDLRRLPKRGGSRAIAFIERYVRVPKGEGARTRLKLRPWQRAIVHGLFDEPRPRQALVSIPRGNGKTTMAAALGIFGLLGDGVEGAQVVCVASDERQAGILLRTARRMVELDADLAARVQTFKDHLEVPHTGSTLFALPADPGALQGWDPSLCVVDELHVVREDVFEAMSLAAGKRDRSLLLAISTPAQDSSSVMWRLVEHGRSGEDPSFYFTEFAAPVGCALDDEDAWAEGNPALHDFLSVDAMRAVLKTSREASFRRYRLGQWVQADDAWLPAAAWQSCADPGRGIPDGADVVVAFDGSYSGDTTAAVVVVLVDPKPHVEVLALWEPAEQPDKRVPVLQVEETLRRACQQFRVRALACDPFRWSRSMEILESEGLPVMAYPQVPVRMTPATTRFGEAVMNGTLSHSADPRLTAHIANAVIREDGRGARLAKETKWSKRRIDLAVAAVMALDVAATIEPAEPDYDVLHPSGSGSLLSPALERLQDPGQAVDGLGQHDVALREVDAHAVLADRPGGDECLPDRRYQAGDGGRPLLRVGHGSARRSHSSTSAAMPSPLRFRSSASHLARRAAP
jgi:phage terminase large subunit-like protein